MDTLCGAVPRIRGWKWWLALWIVAATVPVRAATPGDGVRPLGVSPLLVDAAAEVWSVVARPDNPVWPGWDATDTPLLLYLPGIQDLLINHPQPPPGFVPYDGPLSIPGTKMWVKNGETLISYDGQNTAMDVGGTRTLVVADPLSNLRQRVAGLIEDGRPATEKVRGLKLEDLAPDPYDQLGLVVHEAFHVYQHRTAPDRSANEMLLLHYPVLSVENNVGFGLEAEALSDAIRAADPAVLRRAAVRWLAVREQRRAALPKRAIEYEDGVEFGEGLAKYTEYRLFQVLEGRDPAPGRLRVQGFTGYADLSPQRENLLDQMKRHLRGEVNVNNSPYGTAPLRMRLYYSGLGIGILLDRIAPEWKQELWSTDSSMTALARRALAPTAEELAAGLRESQADTARAALLAAKTRLAEDGRDHIGKKVAALERGPGTKLVVAYGALPTTGVALGFSPFGLDRVDADRVLFAQVPISAGFSDGSELEETIALPVLRDTRKFELRLALEQRVSAARLASIVGAGVLGAREPRALKLELPGVKLDLKSATLAFADNTLRVTLHPAAGTSKESR